MPTPAVLREIRRATQFNGVTTTSELRLTQTQTNTCVRNGSLLRLHDGVFADPSHPRTPVHLLAAGVAGGGRLSAAWARSAAAISELRRDHPPRPEIVVPYGRIRRLKGVSVRRSRVLKSEMLTMRQHIRVTKPVVTVIDCGVVLSPVEVADMIIVARNKRFFSLGEFHDAIDEYARPGRTGIGVAREAAELVLINGRLAESVLEFRFHIGPGREGLPPYDYQYAVRIGQRNYRIDFAYPEVRLAIEVEGYEFHSSWDAIRYDRVRRADLERCGWTVLTFGWDRVVHDPIGVAIEILLKLRQLGYGVERIAVGL